MKRRNVKLLHRTPKRQQTVGIPATARYVPATEVKNKFANVLETVLKGRPAVITKHGSGKAILISIEQFETVAPSPEAELNSLTAEFDRLLESMQTEKAARAMQTAFDAPPKELGRSAVRGVRRS
jgi:antitoxin Phd